MNGVFNRSRMEKRGLNLCFFNKKTLTSNSSGDECKPHITQHKSLGEGRAEWNWKEHAYNLNDTPNGL